MTPDTYHIPALLSQSINALDIHPDGIYADATFGGGGHSRAILNALGNDGKLLGFDRDIDAFANRPDDKRFTFVHSDFRYMQNFMRYYGISHFDGILADLGVSFHHFDAAGRGFSFRADAPLDMRMNQKGGITAADIVNDFDEERLAEVLKIYGEIKKARLFASEIIKHRPIETTLQLVEAVAPLIDPRKEKKEMAQLFQALRIEVNGEMEALRKFLLSTPRMLREGGRLAILTYHSLEDRMVKNFLKTGNIAGEQEKDFFGRVSTPWRLITRTPITADADEVERNPRARSAKLRVAELVESPED